MTGTPPSAAIDGFASLLQGRAIPFAALKMTSEEFLRTASDQHLTGLICQRLRTLESDGSWPQDVRDALTSDTRSRAARELLCRKELAATIDALAADGIRPVVLKGAALAYSVYDSPESRPRVDTDLLVRRADVETALAALVRRGYTAPPYCEGDLLFGQFPLTRTDEFGVRHDVDLHWKISTQTLFADLLTFSEISADAVPLPAAGAHARMAGPVHALLLACVHPVMHHRNVESLLWLYDIHLLVARLSGRELERFCELAVARRVSAICAHQIAAARGRYGTRIFNEATSLLGAGLAHEPSAVYLRPHRRWHDELVSNIRGLPKGRDRLRLLREVVLPGPRYMMKTYRLDPSSLNVAVLPFLYIHRLAYGCWKVLAGQK